MDEAKTYRQNFERVLVRLLERELDWKARADQLERMVVDNGLLPESALPLSRESPWGFAQNLIEDQDVMLENSNLINLQERKWDPESASSAKVLVRHLLVMEREQAEHWTYPKYKQKAKSPKKLGSRKVTHQEILERIRKKKAKLGAGKSVDARVADEKRKQFDEAVARLATLFNDSEK